MPHYRFKLGQTVVAHAPGVPGVPVGPYVSSFACYRSSETIRTTREKRGGDDTGVGGVADQNGSPGGSGPVTRPCRRLTPSETVWVPWWVGHGSEALA